MAADLPYSTTHIASSTGMERAVLWLVVAILAWAQFPLGSNRPWSWSLLVIMVAITLITWAPVAFANPTRTIANARRIAFPGCALLAVLGWAYLQSVQFTPASWHHPIWTVAADALHRHLAGAISINPYDTQTELMKLTSYVAIGWLAYAISENRENAHTLLKSVFFVGVAYAAYGIALSSFQTSQFTLLEGLPTPYGRDVSGGFVNKNSFATFSGITFLVGVLLLYNSGRHEVIARRGWRTLLATLLQFGFRRGAPYLIGSIVLFSALVASNSRAGLIATLLGVLAVFALVLVLSFRKPNFVWALVGGGGAGAIMLGLFLVNGHDLQSRLSSLVETAGVTELRPILWGAALRAIEDRPTLGTGLGTYANTYHLYANSFVPFVVDRAHNDYLELGAGLGLPAASIWVLSIMALTLRCATGVLRRHRRHIYALAAVGASTVVGFHSLFDFSLQMPAVSVLYSVVLGVGLAQAIPRREGPEVVRN